MIRAPDSHGERSATLRIRLFGALDLRLGDQRLPPLDGARSRSLFGYLLLHREAPQSRQRLAYLFWPDTTDAQARTNLRHVLHKLRCSIPDPTRFVEITPQTLQWRSDAPYWLDVAAFEQCSTRAESETGDRAIDLLCEGATLYTGDLLEACYDEWIEVERARLRHRHVAALERLVLLLEERGAHADAIPYASRLLREDPLREDIHRLLMRLHRARGDRASALEAYNACVEVLRRELGVSVSSATEQERERILVVTALPVAPDAHVHSGETAWPALVGRTTEWARVTDVWCDVEGGRSRFLLVSGEPGIGKTRLMEELANWCGQRGAGVARARCYAAEGALAYAPVVAWLRAEAFRPHLLDLDRRHLAELARLLPELTAVPGVVPASLLSENEQRRLLFDAVAEAIRAAAAPVLLVVDDLQWCDRDTLELLHYVVRTSTEQPLLIAGTARWEEVGASHALSVLVAELRAQQRLTEVALSRLPPGETADLARLLRSAPLDAAAADALFRETEGNPLFVIELLRAGWPSEGRTPFAPGVQAVIEARLARLSETARELAGAGAVLGRAFHVEVLERSSDLPIDAVVRGLDELWHAGIVREQGVNRYDFSHDRIREVAHASLSPPRRRHHHLRAAQALKHVNAAEPAAVSAQIAAHYDQAGVTAEAIHWYESAAAAAQSRYSSRDAFRFSSRALELLRMLPATPEHQALELALLTGLLWPLASTRGFAAEDLSAAQNRALDLVQCLGVEAPPALLRSLAIAALAREDFVAAERHGHELLARSRVEANDPLLAVEGAYVLGIAAFWRGELERARRYFEKASRTKRAQSAADHLVRYGLDPRVISLSRLANTLCLLGDVDSARAARAAALDFAKEVGHPFTRATVLTFAALMAIELGEHQETREYIAALEAEPDDSLQTRVGGRAMISYGRALDGAPADAVGRLRAALDDLHGHNYAPGMRGMILRVLLAAYREAGDARGQLEAADALLEIGGSARIWESEAHRARAECLTRLGHPAIDVDAALARAIEVALRQGARLFAQRAERLATRVAQSRASEA